MKRLLLLILITAVISCTKDKEPSISGRWTLVEVTSMGTQTQLAPGEIILHFSSNGTLSVSGTLQDTARNPMLNFNRYEVVAENKIRFFHATSPVEMQGQFHLESGLSLGYDWARCPYQEKFIRY